MQQDKLNGDIVVVTRVLLFVDNFVVKFSAHRWLTSGSGYYRGGCWERVSHSLNHLRIAESSVFETEDRVSMRLCCRNRPMSSLQDCRTEQGQVQVKGVVN